MQDESLKRLRRVFGRWRKSKRHARERVPTVLVDDIRQAARVHGLTEVARITGSVARKIVRRPAGKEHLRLPAPRSAAMPTFSRIRLEPTVGQRPILEAESPSGLKVRIFSREPEALDLLRNLLSLPKEEAS